LKKKKVYFSIREKEKTQSENPAQARSLKHRRKETKGELAEERKGSRQGPAEGEKNDKIQKRRKTLSRVSTRKGRKKREGEFSGKLHGVQPVQHQGKES